MPTAADAHAPSFAMSGVGVRFGGLAALQDVSLEVGRHEVVGVIGPNGAGKTTLFNVACGFVQPDEGTLERRGERIDRLRPWMLPGLGMARTLQGLGLFDRMSALDNVLVGADRHARTGFWTSLLALPRGDRDGRDLRERAFAVMEQVGVADVADWLPPSLPYPVRKRVALARALVSEPDLLLLDEPASGLSNAEMDDLGDLVRSLTSRMSVVLVEHHMDLVMSVSDHLVVLDFGTVIARGGPDEVRRDPAVLAAYLGDEVERDEVGRG